MYEVYDEPFTLYEIGIESLDLRFTNGATFDATSALKNGRASYILFEQVVGHFAGLESGSQGGRSDLLGAAGVGYEVKSYRDPGRTPSGPDMFHTAASSTFGANNHGPRLKALLNGGDYASAMNLCYVTGYSKNDFYVYTNTSGFTPDLPLRYFIVPTASVLACLSPLDPRLVSRSALLALLQASVRIN